MEVQLKELLEKIKSEGIESADLEAKRILEEAEKKAAETSQAARKEAERIVLEAKQEASQALRSGEAALSQAARDMLLNVQAKLKALFQQLVTQSAQSVYSSTVLEEAVVTLMKGWTADPASELTVVVPADRIEAIEKGLRTRLADEITQGLTIEPSPGVDAGFRLVRKDGAAYYDFSARSIAEILGEYLNPRLAKLLRESVDNA